MLPICKSNKGDFVCYVVSLKLTMSGKSKEVTCSYDGCRRKQKSAWYGASLFSRCNMLLHLEIIAETKNSQVIARLFPVESTIGNTRACPHKMLSALNAHWLQWELRVINTLQDQALITVVNNMSQGKVWAWSWKVLSSLLSHWATCTDAKTIHSAPVFY